MVNGKKRSLAFFFFSILYLFNFEGTVTTEESKNEKGRGWGGDGGEGNEKKEEQMNGK